MTTYSSPLHLVNLLSHFSQCGVIFEVSLLQNAFLLATLYHIPTVQGGELPVGEQPWPESINGQKVFTTILCLLKNEPNAISLKYLKTAVVFFPFLFCKPLIFLGKMSSTSVMEYFFLPISAVPFCFSVSVSSWRLSEITNIF